MSAGIQPITYTNATYGITVTAVDANTKLDYPGVIKACDEILTVSETEMGNIGEKISSVKLGKEALCVEDTSMQPIIDEVGILLQALPAQEMTGTLEEVKSLSLQVHDEFQTEENEKAKAEFNNRVNAAVAKAEAKAAAQN